MTVKGNTIVGFDEVLSIQKTLRKPEETLKEFKSSGKIKLRRFLDEIKTIETKLNGRFTTDIVILKAN
jgi:DNA-directed RNA polymerase beta' subunit